MNDVLNLNTFAAAVLLSTVAIYAENYVAPQITQEVRNLTVAMELVVSFVCKASGNPQPTFYWEKDGKKLNIRRNRSKKVFDMPYGSVLRIETVRNKDSGSSFTCVAENGVGDPARSTGHLKVYGFDREGNGEVLKWKTTYKEFPTGYPKIIVNPELKSVEKEKPAIMQCQADANGHKFDIEWFKNGVPVDLGDNKRLTITETGSLRIAKALESDYGKYECVATNDYGVIYSYAAMLYIRVRRVPPHFTLPPKRVEVDPNGSVNLTCVAVGSPMPHVMWRDGATELGKPVIGKNVLQLKNVTESKNYTCVASSDLGNIEHVGEVIVKAPGTPPRYVTAKALNSNTVSVSWLPPEKPNGVIQGYRVFYTLQADLPIILWNNKEVQSNTNETIITGLKPNDTFTICVLAYSSKGEGPVSQLITVITNEGSGSLPRVPPIFTPLPPKRVEVDPNGSVNLTCVAVGSPMPHVMWRDGATELGKPVIGKNFLQLKNITESKNYTCVASSDLGNIEHIGEVIVKVQPRNIFAEVTGPNTIDVSWDPPSQTRNVVTKYFVYYNDTYLKQESHLVVQGTETKCQLEELTPDTVYTIKVSAISNKGEGAATRIIQAKTLPFVPDEPTNVTAEAINSTAMFVDWQPPEGRDKGATYEFRVKAKNEVGLGERASAVIITPDGGLIAGKGSRSCVISLAT